MKIRTFAAFLLASLQLLPLPERAIAAEEGLGAMLGASPQVKSRSVTATRPRTARKVPRQYQIHPSPDDELVGPADGSSPRSPRVNDRTSGRADRRQPSNPVMDQMGQAIMMGVIGGLTNGAINNGNFGNVRSGNGNRRNNGYVAPVNRGRDPCAPDYSTPNPVYNGPNPACARSPKQSQLMRTNANGGPTG